MVCVRPPAIILQLRLTRLQAPAELAARGQSRWAYPVGLAGRSGSASRLCRRGGAAPGGRAGAGGQKRTYSPEVVAVVRLGAVRFPTPPTPPPVQETNPTPARGRPRTPARERPTGEPDGVRPI